MQEVKRKKKSRWMTEETLKVVRRETKVTSDKKSRVRILNADYRVKRTITIVNVNKLKRTKKEKQEISTRLFKK